MWPYKEITREEFEHIKDKIENIIVRLGGRIADISLPYVNKTSSISSSEEVAHISNRPVYEYKREFYRVSEVCFDRPFIVIECGDYDDLIFNRMEDANPFPYNLPDHLLEAEVMYSLGVLPYPAK